LFSSLNGTSLFLSKKPTSIAVAPLTAKLTPREMTSELFASEAGRNGSPNASAERTNYLRARI
jgi:hypothetical protein